MPGRRSDAFRRALEEVGRKDRAPDDPGPTGGARVRGVTFGPGEGSGGKARFGLALDWADEPEDQPTSLPQRPRPAPSEPPARSADTMIEIATELGLGEALTLDQLTSRWRDFVWRNHPDRQPMDVRERGRVLAGRALSWAKRSGRTSGALARANPEGA
jgi:hypothetical protein